jgi:hypothetical protein
MMQEKKLWHKIYLKNKKITAFGKVFGKGVAKKINFSLKAMACRQ